MVPHPDQSNTQDNDFKFIQSFRAVGEGHVSSILFGEGIIKKNGDIVLEKNSPFLEQGEISHISDTVYEINFSEDSEISSRIIFPVVENERMGLEDARFVRFINDPLDGRGKYTYFATYTAYDGNEISPKLPETNVMILKNSKLLSLKVKEREIKEWLFSLRK